MRPYKSLIVGTVIAVTLGLMALDRTHMTSEDAPIATHSNAIVPDVTFMRLGGGALKLHSLAGHTVWLHFWASWCVPCRQEFSDLLKRIEKNDATLLAVSADKKEEDVQRFLAPYRHDFKSLFDTGRVIIAIDSDRHVIEGTFQTFQYPETIIIGPDLAMQHKIAGVFTE